MWRVCVIALLGVASAAPVLAQYQLPPKEIVEMLDAPPLPAVSANPTQPVVALLERASMPSIADLAQPMLRLAGIRVNPRTNGLHRAQTLRGVTLKRYGDRLTGSTDVTETAVTLPPNPKLAWIGFSPDGLRFAFTQTRDTGIELWMGDTATGQARSISAATLNGIWGEPCEWLADSSALLCRFVSPSRGAPPAAPDVPAGPNIQENLGKPSPVRTYQDLLTSAHDEALFEYYGTSLLAIVDAATGARRPVGAAGLYERAEMSPNGEYVLVTRLKRPFSRLVPAEDFAKDVEIWNRRGDVVRRIADLPIADSVPNNGVLPGPREYRWHAAEPATLVWAEALDEGDPRKTVPHRDRLVALGAPFTGAPAEIMKTEYRFRSIAWTDAGTALVVEFDRTRRWNRTWVLDRVGATPRRLWDVSADDRYANPGAPVRRPASPYGVIVQAGDAIYTSGDGGSPEGDRPFLARVNLRTGAAERLFQSDASHYEQVVALLADDGRTYLTRRESPADPPNYFVRSADGTARPITALADPAPQLRGVTKQLLTYTRSDGVRLSATLYLPPTYRNGERLPLLLWAYPREFADPSMASQVVGSPNRFPLVDWSTLYLVFLTQGYAVLDNPTMPIVGPGETANDTYVEQLVASAQAAVDTVVNMGVADRDRVVAGGHSYGAFMTANLLAHSDIFRAGIARSGAYNRTLTPFGFQNESRTFWEATGVYTRMSPFWYANAIKEPILLIHGEADDNSGTFPIQSERFYMALKGHGATVRYVTLPLEAHRYLARESVLHTVAEMLAWADKYAKHAGPRTAPTQ